jgi:myosin heavy subunit
MLGLDSADVQKCVCESIVKVGKEVLPRHNLPDQAKAARDTLVKYVYNQLFEWVIHTINSSFETLRVVTKSNHKRFVGVLDIFGFESFTENSLEQLCINFCNGAYVSCELA